MPDIASTDKASVDVSELLLRSDIQIALVEVLEQLPKLAPVLRLAGTGVEAAREIITNPDLLGTLEDVVLDRTRPMQKSATDVMSMIKEAKQRAAQGNEYIGVFGLLRLLKDPNVQYMLRFAQAFADVCGEHRRKSAASTASPQ